jgi:hypoxanthine phosphoribosyltransferase
LKTRSPKSVEYAVLLVAPKQKRKVDSDDARWTGFHIGDKFVVGYGLDCAGKYRNLPYM